MRTLDFSSLHALTTTLLSLAVITLIGVGIRLLTMVTIQQRRERMNRQINERLRALIAAYKTLGGSFTGTLTVDPAHLRDLRRHAEAPSTASTEPLDLGVADSPGSDRARRVRDAVEAALSDIILLGTEEQVRLAAGAAQELATGRLVHTQELVVSLRAFIREALDLDPIHRRNLHWHAETPAAASTSSLDLGVDDSPGSDRARRIRDAVEAALSDIILLGTEEQVRLAVHAAHELATGKLVHTQELVVSLRAFIREALDLDPIPSDLAIPLQGPARPTASGGRDKADKGEGRQGGGGGGGGGGMGGGGVSGGLGLGSGSHHQDGDEEEDGADSSLHHV